MIKNLINLFVNYLENEIFRELEYIDSTFYFNAQTLS
jgi:hypothetical protein